MDAGFIVLWRKITEWRWYGDPVASRLFIHFLVTANHKPSWFQGELIDRGQLITGRKELSETLGISEKSVRLGINKLKETNEITTKTTNRFSIITVVKYSDYQDKKEKGASEKTYERANKGPTEGQQGATSKQCNNDNKEKNSNKYIFIPPSVSEISEYAKEINRTIDSERFHDYYMAKGWMIGKSKMKDWRAAVRNWTRDQRPAPAKKTDEFRYELGSNGEPVNVAGQRKINAITDMVARKVGI